MTAGGTSGERNVITVVDVAASDRYAAADERRRSRTNTLLAAAAVAEAEGRSTLLGEVVELNMGVAEALARRYRDRGVAADDLQQVAFLALVKAANGFDTARAGTDFLTYAVPTIRGELRKHFRDHGWMVRPPRRIQELQTMVHKASEEVTRTLQRSPRPSDLAAHLEVEESEIIEALSADGCFTPFSLDHPQASGSGAWGDNEGAEDPGHLAAEAQLILAPLLKGLKERDRLLVRRRFYDGWTQRQIGAELGISQMQVSRHLTRILAALREQVGELIPGSTAA
jgi:RNA polymerase sigma-B factor